MDGMFQTFQEFMAHADGATYLLIIGALIGIGGFWHFLTQRDGDE
jgi:hypothetical protein